jgi:hypothetical protein
MPSTRPLLVPTPPVDVELTCHLEVLVNATSLYAVLHALVRLCYTRAHQQHGETLSVSENWQALGQRLTQVETSARFYEL